MFDITISKSSDAVALLPSVQVTLTDSVPTLAFNGVPVNSLVLAVKVSQPGSALPSVCVAV